MAVRAAVLVKVGARTTTKTDYLQGPIGCSLLLDSSLSADRGTALDAAHCFDHNWSHIDNDELRGLEQVRLATNEALNHF